MMLTISLKYMTFRKITIVYSVKYVPQNEQTEREREILNQTQLKKQKKISQNEKFIENLAAGGFGILK